MDCSKLCVGDGRWRWNMSMGRCTRKWCESFVMMPLMNNKQNYRIAPEYNLQLFWIMFLCWRIPRQWLYVAAMLWNAILHLPCLSSVRPGFGLLGVYENYIYLDLEQCIAGYLLQYHMLIIVILAPYHDCIRETTSALTGTYMPSEGK